jgi:hypothetical protein
VQESIIDIELTPSQSSGVLKSASGHVSLSTKENDLPAISVDTECSHFSSHIDAQSKELKVSVLDALQKHSNMTLDFKREILASDEKHKLNMGYLSEGLSVLSDILARYRQLPRDDTMNAMSIESLAELEILRERSIQDMAYASRARKQLHARINS